MLDQRRSQGLRLEIDLEASTEASSEQMERDWSRAEATIARRTGKRTRTSIRPWSVTLI
jgi:hypothetical protein